MTATVGGTTQSVWWEHLAGTLEPPEPQNVLGDWPPTHRPDRLGSRRCNGRPLAI